jgi:Protein of unknown function (DUF3300)
MNSLQTRSRVLTQTTRNFIVVLCVLFVVPGDTLSFAMQDQQQQPQQQPQASADQANQDAKLSPDQLDSLVAPLALYPDQLLSQTLVACTYPLEIVQLQQFLEKNKNLKDKALTDAVTKQNWDPSVQAMAPFRDVVKQLSDNIKWADDLGNAFLAQQNDVMDAVQRMRKKAADKGALKTTKEQKVETKVVENKSVIVVQQANPEVVYVPSYNPTVVYGPPVVAYPPVAYPPYPAGGMLLSFGVGMAMGAAFSGGWGWNTGWGGHNDIVVNRNNTYVSNYNRNARVNGGNRYGANGNWQHNPAHRGGAPYGNRATANRYGGTARADNFSQRQTAARQNQGQFGARQQPASNQFSSGARNNANSGLNRGAGGGGGDRVGNRQVSSGSMGSRDSSAFSGASSRSAAQASSARGSSSMGSRGGGFSGGGSRGGGGRGGGRRR